jgi:carbonic anhydrase
MSAIDELLDRNRGLSDPSRAHPGGARPSGRVAIVTCMDARIDPLAALGLETGEAHVLRNAGGAITDDVIRSLAISQRLLGTTEVMVIRHTGCGMQGLDEDRFRAELAAAAGTAPAWPIESFADLEDGVRESIVRVRECPLLEHREEVRGFVYELATGRLREVIAE